MIYIIGQQVCRGCGQVQFCTWPADCDVPEAECGCCGDMRAQFAVAFPLAEFPALDGLVQFSEARRALMGVAAVWRDS